MRRPQSPTGTAYVAEQRSRSTGGSDRTVGTYRELTPKGVVRSLHRWVAAAAEMSTGADRWNEAKLLAGLVRLGLLPIVCVVASPPPAAPARRRPRAWRRRRTWRRPPNDPNGKLEDALAVPPVECVQHLHAVLGDGRLVGVQSRRQVSTAPASISGTAVGSTRPVTASRAPMQSGRKTAGHQTDRSWRSDAGLDTARHCPGCRAGDSGAGDDCGRRNSTVKPGLRAARDTTASGRAPGR